MGVQAPCVDRVHWLLSTVNNRASWPSTVQIIHHTKWFPCSHYRHPKLIRKSENPLIGEMDLEWSLTQEKQEYFLWFFNYPGIYIFGIHLCMLLFHQGLQCCPHNSKNPDESMGLIFLYFLHKTTEFCSAKLPNLDNYSPWKCQESCPTTHKDDPLKVFDTVNWYRPQQGKFFVFGSEFSIWLRFHSFCRIPFLTLFSRPAFLTRNFWMRKWPPSTRHFFFNVKRSHMFVSLAHFTHISIHHSKTPFERNLGCLLLFFCYQISHLKEFENY